MMRGASSSPERRDIVIYIDMTIYNLTDDARSKFQFILTGDAVQNFQWKLASSVSTLSMYKIYPARVPYSCDSTFVSRSSEREISKLSKNSIYNLESIDAALYTQPSRVARRIALFPRQERETKF